MGELVGLAVDGLLGQQVLSLVGEDGVYPLSASAANVGAEHDAVVNKQHRGQYSKSFRNSYPPTRALFP